MQVGGFWTLGFVAALSDFEPTSTFWWKIAALVLLVLLSGFFSGAEIALFRLSRTRRRHLIEEGVHRAKIVDRLMQRPNRVLITILIGNNLVNVGSAALATAIAIDIFGNTGIGIATGVMTFLLLIFGEITPKAYASRHSQRVSIGVAPPLRLLQRVLFPLVWFLELITDAIFRLLGARRHEERTFMSSDEIRTLIDVGTEEGVLEEEEQEMIHGVISFGELMAKEVMVPRPDMECLRADSTVAEAVSTAISSGYSRLPVFKGNKDNVVGILYTKDMLRLIQEGRGEALVGDVAREPLFVPESSTLDDVLTQLQERRVHMAIVVDEFGGTAGVVTMEDLLEEIVGEIFDEYDLRREAIRRVGPDVAIVDARVHVDDVNEALGTDIPEDEVFETVGGFIHHTLGRLPDEGESFDAHGLSVKVEKLAGRRILRVRLEGIGETDADD